MGASLHRVGHRLVEERSSNSKPPRCVSPLVAFASKKPESMFSSYTSKVPPPRSQSRMFYSLFLPRPYVMAAAVGSLMMHSTFRTEISPAWRVATSMAITSVIRASMFLFNF